ncbi:TRAP transporter substrate-binding protein DctP [Roseomonas sp. NAR14]|uniref:TRAP transporter substrate-binding protein DctP n=1 Tax=Roseomonas acroporae TaxID=2937791 RepID=A0A9X1Y8L8_9PROT|nr:TRAP transporter substrate-binding protein DctP [Roseomonas acroporae]MCK8785523.1 TRAP transporter substrate-binding protein DctP [Roseomonas acroporae]
MHPRRALLGAAAAAAPALAAPALAQPALAQTTQAMPELRWRLTSSFPRTVDIIHGTGELVCRRVAALTDNRFQIRMFAAGEIVPGLQALDAVQNATVECALAPTYFFMGKEPSFAVFTAMPFGLNTRQLSAWLTHGGGKELSAELFRDYNVIGFPCGDTGAQMGGWFRREVKSLEDIKGLKFRIAGLAGEIFKRLGATPSAIAPADIYPSLERGTIDAVEFTSPYDDEKLGFYRIAPYYYYPGFWDPGARLHFMVNQRAWEALPPLYREALEVACADANADMLARYDNANPGALRRLIANGTQLRPWSRDIMAASYKAMNEITDEISGRDARFRRIWESYRKYRDEEFVWFRIAENSLENFSFTAAQTVR